MLKTAGMGIIMCSLLLMIVCHQSLCCKLLVHYALALDVKKMKAAVCFFYDCSEVTTLVKRLHTSLCNICTEDEEEFNGLPYLCSILMTIKL